MPPGEGAEGASFFGFDARLPGEELRAARTSEDWPDQDTFGDDEEPDHRSGAGHEDEAELDDELDELGDFQTRDKRGTAEASTLRTKTKRNREKKNQSTPLQCALCFLLCTCSWDRGSQRCTCR